MAPPSPPVNIIFSQPTDRLRFIEATTEGSHLEALFLLCDHARDSYFRQLKESIPIPNHHSVVRSMHVKLDHHWVHNFPKKPDPRNPLRTRPHDGQLYRAETRITHIGTRSLKLQHRFFTVPASQVNRDFNDRSQDALYSQQEGEEPARLFASAEGAIVFIKWQQDPTTGRRFYKPTLGPYHDSSLMTPSVIDFVGGSGPGRRTQDQPRPSNAFRVPILLRQSDKDSLGHVTNSRYASIINDVFVYSLQQGYYANGSGAARTEVGLPVLSAGPHGSEEKTATHGSQGAIAVPAGAQFYKQAKVHELYVGYEDELKVKPGVVVWSWVERERLEGRLDVAQFEICATDEAGVEKVVSQCRAVFLENGVQKASL
ncbi:hypothetical protein MVEG_11310 [Podila verticillata NRRL 6337]|uniref:Uncharacterized protein n=1 Tax=Podila verticillata NRRL 6337 TaxID=1069443 RepID=A0A086TLF7_9FUNG|nr:hypothetical protein MVEG_11310 [Podila verticillata NRRL 6337]